MREVGTPQQIVFMTGLQLMLQSLCRTYCPWSRGQGNLLPPEKMVDAHCEPRFLSKGAVRPSVTRMPLQLRDWGDVAHEQPAVAGRAAMLSISGRKYANQINGAGGGADLGDRAGAQFLYLWIGTETGVPCFEPKMLKMLRKNSNAPLPDRHRSNLHIEYNCQT